MEFFENLNEASEKWSDAGKSYVEKSHEYYKLKVFQYTSDSIGLVTKILLIGGLLLMALFFLAFAFSMYLGDVLNNQVLGFIIVALTLILIGAIVYYCRRLINNTVVKRLSPYFFDK